MERLRIALVCGRCAIAGGFEHGGAVRVVAQHSACYPWARIAVSRLAIHCHGWRGHDYHARPERRNGIASAVAGWRQLSRSLADTSALFRGLGAGLAFWKLRAPDQRQYPVSDVLRLDRAAHIRHESPVEWVLFGRRFQYAEPGCDQNPHGVKHDRPVPQLRGGDGAAATAGAPDLARARRGRHAQLEPFGVQPRDTGVSGVP